MDIDKTLSILQCKCPSCRDGKMFYSRGNPLLFKIPKMNPHCTQCDYKFEMEPGFFYGAMYVSYAIAVAQMVACFIIFWVLMDLPKLAVLFIIGGSVFLTSTLNFRLSRTIWVYMFHRPKKY